MKTLPYSTTTLRKLQSAYLTAKAENERVKALEEKIKTRVLSENIFFTEPEEDEPSERITNTMSDFRMNDEDFNKYLDLIHELKPQYGLTNPRENTADYQTRGILKAAEDRLLDYGVEILPNTPEFDRSAMNNIRTHWKYRYEMIELICKL